MAKSAPLGKPDATWGDALLLGFLAALPVAVAVWVAGVSPQARAGILVVAGAALSPVIFLALRIRRRRAWQKRWQGPALMYRSVPPAPVQVVADCLIEDRGSLRSMPPGARYQFADDPSGFLLGDLVLVGTRAGIMAFLAEQRERRIENRTSLPGAGIYMTVGPYRPAERFKVERGLGSARRSPAFGLRRPERPSASAAHSLGAPTPAEHVRNRSRKPIRAVCSLR